MCGIAGIITNFINSEHKKKMLKMLDVMKHRGPDYSNYQYFDDNVIFGHNRLAIIDLSFDANQPFSSNDGNYSIVFNGEIYNYIELRKILNKDYRFKTNSDTEVLLAAYIKWKEKAFEKFQGMFSFAIFDNIKKKIILCRDRFGVKPLYYHLDNQNNSFYFASEIKGLHAAGIEKNENEVTWSSFLNYGLYNNGDQTFWENINLLKPGHCIELKFEKKISKKIIRWYNFEESCLAIKNSLSFQSKSTSEHLLHYKELLVNSVKNRFRSDVKVGFNLSGGLDSSILYKAISDLFSFSKVESFTFQCNNEKYDEIEWAKNINPDTNSILLSPKEIPDLAKKVSYYQDEPYGGIPTLAYSKIFSEARKKGVIVLLDGQGMDEAWAGYDYYLSNSNNIVQGTNYSPLRKNVLKNDFKKLSTKFFVKNIFNEDLLNKQYRDIFQTKLQRALRFNDRISMMSSTELREPFLDHSLVEYAFCLPKDLKIQNKISKWGLRKLSIEMYDKNLLLAPKRPVQTPQTNWLRNDLKEWACDSLNDVKAKKGAEWFNISDFDSEVDLFFNSKNTDNSFFIWQWLSIKLLNLA